MQTTWHRNLNATNGNAWSFNTGNGATQARVVYSKNTTAKQPSGKKFDAVLNGTGNRSVFAWFKTASVLVNESAPIVPAHAVQIRFNPKKGQRYFQANDGVRVDFMREAWGKADGTCWAIL
jgi:hypothetical protein